MARIVDLFLAMSMSTIRPNEVARRRAMWTWPWDFGRPEGPWPELAVLFWKARALFQKAQPGRTVSTKYLRTALLSHSLSGLSSDSHSLLLSIYPSIHPSHIHHSPARPASQASSDGLNSHTPHFHHLLPPSTQPWPTQPYPQHHSAPQICEARPRESHPSAWDSMNA